MGAGRTVRPDFHLLVRNLARHQLDTRRVSSARAGQTNVSGVDAERVHQMQQLDLFLDRRFAHRGRLQSIAQRLIIKADVTIGLVQLRLDCVPIVN